MAVNQRPNHVLAVNSHDEYLLHASSQQYATQ